MWVFISVRGLSRVVASGGHSSLRCAGPSLSRPLLLRSTSSRRSGSVVVAHWPSCSAACGIFPDQGSNPCPLHWQADPQPLRYQGSPSLLILMSLSGPFNLASGGFLAALPWLANVRIHPLELREGHGGWNLAYKKRGTKDLHAQEPHRVSLGFKPNRHTQLYNPGDFPGGPVVTNPPSNARDVGFDTWSGN